MTAEQQKNLALERQLSLAEGKVRVREPELARRHAIWLIQGERGEGGLRLPEAKG